MQRKASPRVLTAAFVVVSAAVSIAVLGVRNLYDDEISSLARVTSSVGEIVSATAAKDMHPPGMYLLAHIAYGAIPSFRWMNLFPCFVLYAGLAAFLVEVVPLVHGARARYCLLLLATLHPQLLLWGNTFRWYSWWTGLALIALTVALRPSTPRPRFGIARGVMLGVLLACLFYLNYITILFAIALGAAMLLRYRRGWRPILTPELISLGVFLALIAPQLHIMLAAQLAAGMEQRSGVAVSLLRLLESTAVSEAYLPWHPLAIGAGVVFVGISLAGVAVMGRLMRERRTGSAGTGEENDVLAVIALFGVVFCLLVAVAGFGDRPRNGLLLIPVLAPVTAPVVGTLRPRMQLAVLLFAAVWSAVGIEHMLGRHGLAKATMNDRPEEVVAYVGEATVEGCAVVVTYDAPLAFELTESKLPRMLIVTPFSERILGGQRGLSEGCTSTVLYVVESYQGEDTERQQAIGSELETATKFIRGEARVREFSFDPDAAPKRELARLPRLGGSLADAARLPDYRYVVIAGLIARGDIEAMRKGMPDFISGGGAPDRADFDGGPSD